jgi:hypothetical protein
MVFFFKPESSHTHQAEPGSCSSWNNQGAVSSGRLFTLQNLQGLLYRIHPHHVCALIAKQAAVQPDHPNNF